MGSQALGAPPLHREGTVPLVLLPTELTSMRRLLRNCWRRKQLPWRSSERMPPPTTLLQLHLLLEQRKLQIFWICLELQLQLEELQHHHGRLQQTLLQRLGLTKLVTTCYNLLATSAPPTSSPFMAPASAAGFGSGQS